MPTSDNQPIRRIRGRGTPLQPKGRFELLEYQEDLSQLDPVERHQWADRKVPTTYLQDDSRSIVSSNTSPDLPFRFSVNPYRGCAHGCSYCYARPYHEFLGFSAGLDFESKILVKPLAAQLLSRWLARPAWKSEPIMLSGVTDPYQPAERDYQLTRQCLEVALQFHQPLMLITKNALITRDLDLCAELASDNLLSVAVSITSLDQSLVRVMEPRSSAPQARLAAISKLAGRGVPVCAMIAPIIPGLTDSEIPQLLAEVAQAGARTANYTMLRLPGAVEPIFCEWLARNYPQRAERVLGRVRQSRGGRLNQSQFHVRMSATGVWAREIKQTFRLFKQRYRLDGKPAPLDTSKFRRPDQPHDRQRKLF